MPLKEDVVNHPITMQEIIENSDRMKKTFKIIGVLILLILAFSVWYKCTYSMYLVSERTINSKDVKERLLIATQGSAFKDSITQGIVDHYRSDSIFIRIIDITLLPEVQLDDYNAVVLMHTWENWKAPDAAATFLGGLDELQRQRVVVLSTSGSGDEKIMDVDAITGESDLENVDETTDKIIARLNSVLQDQ